MKRRRKALSSVCLWGTDYCHTARRYQVEARARIIFFEEAEAAHLHVQTSASLPQGEPARSMSKEHSGLLSWPESFRRSRGSLGLAAEMLPAGRLVFQGPATEHVRGQRGEPLLRPAGSPAAEATSSRAGGHDDDKPEEAQLFLPQDAIHIQGAASALRAVGGLQHEESGSST